MKYFALKIKENGISDTRFLLCFLFFYFFSQLFFPSFPSVGLGAFLISAIVLIVLLLVGTRSELFLFLFVTTAMSLKIPFSPQRELELILPSAFLIVSVVRFMPKFLRIKKQYTHPLLFFIIIFLGLCFIGVLNGIKIAGINATGGENSGLLNRFNLFNSIVIFVAGLILFDYRHSEQWSKLFFKFYLAVLCVAICVIIFKIGPFPFFNTFSWSLIVENEGSIKMPIAGVAASFVLICTLIFVKDKNRFWFLTFLSLFGLLISGSRISFLAGLLIGFAYFVVKGRILGKSLLVLIAAAVLSFYVLLSPVILLFPEKYQRLVILFPPQYYTGKLSQFAESAAASSSSFRQSIWLMASEAITEKPLIGNSFGAPKADYNFEGNLMEGFQKIPTEILHNDFLVTGSLHNTFFGIAYLLGIPALLLFTYCLVRLTWLHYKMSMRVDQKKREIALFISILLINYIVFAMVTDLIFDLQFFLTLAIAMKIYLFYYNHVDQIFA